MNEAQYKEAREKLFEAIEATLTVVEIATESACTREEKLAGTALMQASGLLAEAALRLGVE